ncbi:hypothetical protein BpHYR1_007146 [Brachionus plicatilis]|uniref:Uncharacterized protein n=1 Tax=Brachionus plicatilis TaxID=10195 RepID=A0A3M7SQ59_BRAPC|nr:hypothetical protein BpHYR1_007146 [Brachionus plicatilis]
MDLIIDDSSVCNDFFCFKFITKLSTPKVIKFDKFEENIQAKYGVKYAASRLLFRTKLTKNEAMELIEKKILSNFLTNPDQNENNKQNELN